MIAAYASVLILLIAATAIGQALVAISRGARRDDPVPFSWLAPAVGIGAMLVLAGVAARLPGRGWTALAVLAVALLGAVVYLRGRVASAGGEVRLGLPVVAITTALASLPFAIAGQVGILGAGLINDDMASHLLIAEYVRDPSGFEPSFIRGGYPTGPHATVVALSELLGADLVHVFAGFTLALAPITGLAALGLLGALSPLRRVLGACLVPLSYLGAAYLSQGAFKEPLQAVILIAFAVLLADVIGVRTAIAAERRDLRRLPPILRVLPLAVLAAASVFNYSLPGLLWVGAVGGLVIAARLWIVRPRPKLPPDWRRRFAPYAVGGILVVALATVQEWSRIADFTRLEALNPDRFGSDLGNLKEGGISVLETLGIWPTGDYRTSASAAGAPAVVFYAGAALGLVALALGLRDARRRELWALPAALVAIAVVWGVTELASTPYIAAKALAIAAPVVMLIAVRGVLSARGPAATALAVAFIAAASFSSFLALRQAPVAPDAHANELEQVREVVQGEEVLFLGRDDFIAHRLYGSGEITGIVANYYSVADARPRFQKGEGGGEKFDVDAVFPKTLDQFRYILEARGGPSSTPPPRMVPVVETPSYVLYERTGLVGRRKTLDEGIEPGAILDCDTAEGREVATGKGTAQIWEQRPVILAPEQRATPGTGIVEWAPDASPSDEQPATETMELEAGRWLISLQYDSRRPLSVRVSGGDADLDAELPANLDFRVTSEEATPFFPVGEIELDRAAEVEVDVEVAEPNLFARLLRAPNQAHLGSLSGTPQDVVRRIQRRQACGEYVDWYRARGD
jgi:hypothetical protein